MIGHFAINKFESEKEKTEAQGQFFTQSDSEKETGPTRMDMK